MLHDTIIICFFITLWTNIIFGEKLNFTSIIEAGKIGSEEFGKLRVGVSSNWWIDFSMNENLFTRSYIWMFERPINIYFRKRKYLFHLISKNLLLPFF